MNHKKPSKAPRRVSAEPTPFEQARDELFQHIMRCDVVGSGISGEVEIVIHVSRRRFGVSNDGVAHRPSDQVEGVAGRPKAVGQVGSCFDQWPQALGEHAPKVVRLT